MTHAFIRTSDYATYNCTKCGLSDYGAEGTECAGRKVWACPTQYNGHTHGTCLVQFLDRASAEEHWQVCHYVSTAYSDEGKYDDA